MEQQLIADYIVQFVAIWTPAITAIAGIIFLICTSFAKIHKQVEDNKKAVAEMKDDTTFKQLTKAFSDLHAAFVATIKRENELIDHIKHVEGYMEAKENGENNTNKENP